MMKIADKEICRNSADTHILQKYEAAHNRGIVSKKCIASDDTEQLQTLKPPNSGQYCRHTNYHAQIIFYI